MSLDLIAQTILGVAAVVALYMTAWFIVALIARRNDLADVAWGIGFITIMLWLLARQGSPLSLRQYVVSGLVFVWGARLAWHAGTCAPDTPRTPAMRSGVANGANGSFPGPICRSSSCKACS
jgi:steroid 5-alpha reductase family enzyme